MEFWVSRAVEVTKQAALDELEQQLKQAAAKLEAAELEWVNAPEPEPELDPNAPEP